MVVQDGQDLAFEPLTPQTLGRQLMMVVQRLPGTKQVRQHLALGSQSAIPVHRQRMRQGVQQQIGRTDVPSQAPPVGRVCRSRLRTHRGSAPHPNLETALGRPTARAAPLGRPTPHPPPQVRDHGNAPRLVERGPAPQLMRPAFFRSMMHSVSVRPRHAQRGHGDAPPSSQAATDSADQVAQRLSNRSKSTADNSMAFHRSRRRASG